MKKEVIERERSRSREKKRNANWFIYDSIDGLSIQQGRFGHMIKNLPIFKKRDEILFNFTASQIMLVTGETGCGKSTQVPRLIYEYIRLTNDPGKIICVQPRRLAVKNLWKILSEQIPETDAVGYQIAMKTRIRESTKIVFMTNGIFLQRLIHNPQVFHEYPFIVLDQVHERDIDTDFILLSMKRLVRRFPKLRIVLMSATIDNKLFQYYFAEDEVDNFMSRENYYKKYIRIVEEERNGGLLQEEQDGIQRFVDERKIGQQIQMDFMRAKQPCPTVNVTQTGKFTKQYFYLDGLSKFMKRDVHIKWGNISFTQKYPCLHKDIYEVVNLILNHILEITKGSRSNSSVLVFMPGLAEIDMMAAEIGAYFGRRAQNFLLIKCHSTLLTDDVTQKLHWQYDNVIKVIIATNIAESSITVLGVKYVLDFCLSKEINFDQKSRMENLGLVWASKASCKQRAGRTGRVCDGFVIRLVQESFYKTLPEYSTPEMQRSSLDRLILRIKLINQNENAETCSIFQDPGEVLGTAIQPPQLKNIDEAIRSLLFCGGLKLEGEKLILTKLGRFYVDIPLDIIYTKMLIFSLSMGTFDDIVILVCLLSQGKNAFRKIHVEKFFLEYYEMMSNFERCDFLSLVNAYKEKSERRMNRNKIQLEIVQETKLLITDITRRMKKKRIHIQNIAQEDYEIRFKITIVYGFLNNLLKVSPMMFDQKQEKRAKLMRKFNIPLQNTVILLNSSIIRKSINGNEEADCRLKKTWIEHISRTFRIPIQGMDMTIGHGISYLHFKHELDLNKFLYVKNIQKNKKLAYQSKSIESGYMNLSTVLQSLGDIDYMEQGHITQFYKNQTILIDQNSINKKVAISNDFFSTNPKYRYLVTNTIMQQNSRLNCKYSSLLPDIPHIEVILHLLFYPFVVLVPDRKHSRYDQLYLKKRTKIKITYDLTDEQIYQANEIRAMIKDLMNLDVLLSNDEEQQEEEMQQDRFVSEGYSLDDPLALNNLRNNIKVQAQKSGKMQKLKDLKERRQKLQNLWGIIRWFMEQRDRKPIISEQKWQQIYFENKKINFEQQKVTFVKEEEKQFMNQIKTIPLNFSYFSDHYKGSSTREQRIDSYNKWKFEKLAQVEELQDRALNHDPYIVCGNDGCNLKIAKVMKINTITDQYFRDLFQIVSGNLIALSEDELDGDHFYNMLMSMYLEKQYQVYGCKNKHPLAIKFKGEKRMKITAFSRVSILFSDGTLDEEPDFERLDGPNWRKKAETATQRKIATKQVNYCFICNQKMNTLRELQSHVKNRYHEENMKEFKETLPKENNSKSNLHVKVIQPEDEY